MSTKRAPFDARRRLALSLDGPAFMVRDAGATNAGQPPVRLFLADEVAAAFGAHAGAVDGARGNVAALAGTVGARFAADSGLMVGKPEVIQHA